MPSRKIVSGILPFFIIIFGVSCFSSRRVVQPVLPIDDTAMIRIDPTIRTKYPGDARCLDSLVREMLDDPNSIFRQPVFSAFFSSPATRLILSERVLSRDRGGFSGKYVKFDSRGFRDKIVFNQVYFATGSRDYFASLIIHETIHDFITWCAMSFRSKQNGVDTTYLRQHFSAHLEWLTNNKKYPNGMQEHILMSENFAGIMVRSLCPYTNPSSKPALRQRIAESLTWVGMSETQAFAHFSLEPCYMLNVDIWARNLDATEQTKAGTDNCDSTDFNFFKTLELVPICKITPP